MAEWKPTLEEGGGPLYLMLAEAILQDVRSGRLAPGSRLPNQRELAETLGASVGTVTRAYQVAESRGAIDSTPGRGTFVRRHQDADSVAGAPLSLDSSLVDLSVAHPLYGQEPVLGPALATLAQEVDVQRLLRYQPLDEIPRYRDAGNRWLRACGTEREEGAEILITSGAQHAGLVLTLALTEPGDLILADEITYPGFLSVAEQTHRRVRGVAMDAHGMLPEALRNTCEEERPRALYLTPTLQNPTGLILPEERRRELAGIAEAYDLLVLEDDTLRLLASAPPPTLASIVPERTFFVGSFSKAVTGGLRVAFVHSPPRYLAAARRAIGASVFMPSPLLVELATRWIEDGTAWDTVARKRGELEERHRIAREILGADAVRAQPQSLYLWLELGEGWRSAEFEAEARRQGVGVTPSRPFSVDASRPPDGVRICLSAAPGRRQLEEALGTLAHLLRNPGSRTPRLV